MSMSMSMLSSTRKTIRTVKAPIRLPRDQIEQQKPRLNLISRSTLTTFLSSLMRTTLHIFWFIILEPKKGANEVNHDIELSFR